MDAELFQNIKDGLQAVGEFERKKLEGLTFSGQLALKSIEDSPWTQKNAELQTKLTETEEKVNFTEMVALNAIESAREWSQKNAELQTKIEELEKIIASQRHELALQEKNAEYWRIRYYQLEGSK